MLLLDIVVSHSQANYFLSKGHISCYGYWACRSASKEEKAFLKKGRSLGYENQFFNLNWRVNRKPFDSIDSISVQRFNNFLFILVLRILNNIKILTLK